MKLGHAIALPAWRRVPGGGVAPPPTPWTPSAISTQLWFDANDAATITLNGTTVSQWNDKSGNTRHATQATTVNQPLLVNNVMNGKPILRFFHNATVNGFNIASAMTDWRNTFVFIVLRPSVVTTLQMIIASSTVNAQIRIQNSPVAGQINVQGAGPSIYGNNTTTPTGISTANATIINVQFATVASIFLDGVSSFVGSANQLTAITFNSIGFLGALTNGLRGDLAEIVVTPLLAQADREKMEGYLAHKWEGSGSANTLDAAHPFKNTPPTI